MLPAQMQVTLTMVCGMLTKFAAGNPAGEFAISLLVILTFTPVMLLGIYLLWKPDFNLKSYLAGRAITRDLKPFLGEEVAKTTTQAVQLAVELVLNPNLDTNYDTARLAGKNSELVLEVVEVVEEPLLEAGCPDAEDIAYMRADLLAIEGLCGAKEKAVVAAGGPETNGTGGDEHVGWDHASASNQGEDKDSRLAASSMANPLHAGLEGHGFHRCGGLGLVHELSPRRTPGELITGAGDTGPGEEAMI
jgi:hypothetical protein